MNSTIDSITDRITELRDKSGKVGSMIITSAAALKSVERADIEASLTVACEFNYAVAEGLGDILVAMRNLAANGGRGISQEKIKNLSRDTREIYHLLTVLIEGMRADPDLNTKYENALSGLNMLLFKVHNELFELEEGNND